jgi:hypothetical protein
MVWLASEQDIMDFYTVSSDAAQSSASITITEFANTYVAGSFTGKLAKMIINGSDVTYKYINVNGTFKVLRVK